MVGVTATVMTFTDCEVEYDNIRVLNVKKSVVSLGDLLYLSLKQ